MTSQNLTTQQQLADLINEQNIKMRNLLTNALTSNDETDFILIGMFGEPFSKLSSETDLTKLTLNRGVINIVLLTLNTVFASTSNPLVISSYLVQLLPTVINVVNSINAGTNQAFVNSFINSDPTKPQELITPVY